MTNAQPASLGSKERWSTDDDRDRIRSTTASADADDGAAQWALVHGDRLVALLAAREGSDVAVHLPGFHARDVIIGVCVRCCHRVVALDERPRVVITADGVIEDGVVQCLKDEVDAIAPGAELVVVVRNLGDVPLAPTMDAYLDVEMIPGRDLWL